MSSDSVDIQARVEYLVPLNKLKKPLQSRLLSDATLLHLESGERLFEQGSRDDFSYYVLEGVVTLYADDTLINTVVGGEGASFQPLSQLQPRQMAASISSHATILQIRRSLLEQLLAIEHSAADDSLVGVEVEEYSTDFSEDWLLSILQSELFTRIPPSNISSLLETLERVEVTSGEDIVRQGDPGDFYYAIQVGTAAVLRQGARQREIKLAELGPGDTFGEEALVSGGRRNATVRMMTPGSLVRLTKTDFARLIQAPMLDAISREEGAQRVARGACWLDVRFADEHRHNGITGSLNIPLSHLRIRLDELDPDAEYIAYCDSGGRSTAAAFLLKERGFTACYVTGGMIRDEGAQTERPASLPETAPADDVIESTAVASALGTELEKAQLTIERACRMMADAEAAKAEAEQMIERRLAEERAKLNAEMEKLQERLAQAERIRADLAAQQQAAADAMQSKEAELEARASLLEKNASQRLHEEQKRLTDLYQAQTAALEVSHEDQEEELKKTLQAQMLAERRKFEQTFLQATEELAEARSEREAALAARDAAQQEARSALQQFKAQQQRLQAEQRSAFQAERERLTEEATRIERLQNEAVQAREAAEKARQSADNSLRQAQARTDASAPSSTDGGVHEFEQRLQAADQNLAQAKRLESATHSAAQNNKDELANTFSTASEINVLLQRELDEWVDEQTRVQESTLQQEVLSRQREMVERIKARANAAKKDAAARNQSLLDEIEQQLRGE